MVKRWHEPISPPKRHCRSRPLVALWLRVTHICKSQHFLLPFDGPFVLRYDDRCPRKDCVYERFGTVRCHFVPTRHDVERRQINVSSDSGVIV